MHLALDVTLSYVICSWVTGKLCLTSAEMCKCIIKCNHYLLEGQFHKKISATENQKGHKETTLQLYHHWPCWINLPVQKYFYKYINNECYIVKKCMKALPQKGYKVAMKLDIDYILIFELNSTWICMLIHKWQGSKAEDGRERTLLWNMTHKRKLFKNNIFFNRKTTSVIFDRQKSTVYCWLYIQTDCTMFSMAKKQKKPHTTFLDVAEVKVSWE